MAPDTTNPQIARELDALCALVEQQHEGVVCAWRGFADPRSPTEDEGIVLEVFFAPDNSGRSLMRSTYDHRENIGAKYDTLISLVVHYTQETITYYLDDVLAILSDRQAAQTTASAMPVSIVDTGGYTAETRTSQRIEHGVQHTTHFVQDEIPFSCDGKGVLTVSSQSCR